MASFVGLPPFEYFGDFILSSLSLFANASFNYIKKLSNRSYKDLRHAPSKDDVVEELTKEESDKIFEHARKIVIQYVKTLKAITSAKDKPDNRK